MEFRMEFAPKSFEHKLKHSDLLFLAGSCFTEQIGAKLKHHKFDTIENPNGILFNPVSISQALIGYINKKKYQKNDLFLHDEVWGSWDHHTRFSALNPEDCLEKINSSQQSAHDFLKRTDCLLLTLGSSFAYRLEDKRVVANCHKVPADKFDKILLSASQVFFHLKTMIDELLAFNPKARIILTVSPVRHLRDGFVENNRSKANLITAVHQLTEVYGHVFYFPAYELVIDDLRDYRFFAEDLVHPNYQATNYVWEKFIQACIDDDSRLIMKEINALQAARNHKPFNPESHQHKEFMRLNAEKSRSLMKKFNHLQLEDLISFFEGHLK